VPQVRLKELTNKVGSLFVEIAALSDRGFILRRHRHLDPLLFSFLLCH
jgi:hypothetical protein